GAARPAVVGDTDAGVEDPAGMRAEDRLAAVSRPDGDVDGRAGGAGAGEVGGAAHLRGVTGGPLGAVEEGGVDAPGLRHDAVPEELVLGVSAAAAARESRGAGP